MSRLMRVGVIGAGVRASAYFRSVPAELRGALRLVAIADPNETNRARFGDLFADGRRPAAYADGATMLAEQELDGVVIASPNDRHVEDAVVAMARPLAVLLEKPVAVSLAECARLRAAQRNSAAQVLVGFVLRYTPFYTRVREIIRSGRLGQVLAVDADENLGTGLTLTFLRGWRRSVKVSGGFMIEKCCHDFDVLSWLLDARPRRAFSMAARSHFVPRPPGGRLPQFESDVSDFDVDFADTATARLLSERDARSPYEIDSDIPDHQSVMIEFDNDVLCTFTACMGQPETNRRLRVYGTAGSLEGDLARSMITLRSQRAGRNDPYSETIEVPATAGGHHGGDAKLADAFFRTAYGEGSAESRAGLNEGIEAVITAYGVQESSRTGSVFDLGELRETVQRTAVDPGAVGSSAGGR